MSSRGLVFREKKGVTKMNEKSVGFLTQMLMTSENAPTKNPEGKGGMIAEKLFWG